MTTNTNVIMPGTKEGDPLLAPDADTSNHDLNAKINGCTKIIIDSLEAKREAVSSTWCWAKKLISDNPIRANWFFLILFQLGCIYPNDLLLLDVLSLKMNNNISAQGATKTSFDYPVSLIPRATICVVMLIFESVIGSMFMRKFTLNKGAEALDSIKDLDLEKLDVKEYAKNESPKQLYYLIAYAVVSAAFLLTASTILATAMAKMQWVNESSVSQNSGSRSSLDEETTSSIEVSVPDLRVFGAMAFFALKHFFISVDLIFTSWGIQGRKIGAIADSNIMLQRVKPLLRKNETNDHTNQTETIGVSTDP